MKVQFFWKTLLFVVFTMTMALNFTSCSEEDEPGLILYSATGNLSASGADAFDALYGIAEYNEAIKNTLGDTYTTSNKDNEVIAACDAVYEMHQSKQNTWKGKVEIKKSKVSISGETSVGEVIKTYNYGN